MTHACSPVAINKNPQQEQRKTTSEAITIQKQLKITIKIIKCRIFLGNERVVTVQFGFLSHYNHY